MLSSHFSVVSFLLVGLSVLLFISPFQAQPYEISGGFHDLGRREGLPRSTVFAIGQDSLGMLWFSTRGGVSRFDGHRFMPFQSDSTGNSIEKEVHVLYVDPLTKDIWMGAEIGLIRLRKGTNQIEHYTHDKADRNSLTRGNVRSILRDASGRLWVGTTSGLNLYIPESNGFQRQNFPDRKSPAIRFILQQEDSTLLFGSRTGLYSLQKGSNSTLVYVQALKDYRLISGCLGPDGSVWMGTMGSGLLNWNAKDNSLRIFKRDQLNPHSLSNDNVRALVSAKDGALWAGTARGLNYLPPGGDAFIRYTSSGNEPGKLSDDFIESLHLDRSGNLWVGTYYGGAKQFDEQYNIFHNYLHDPDRNSLSGNIVSAFAETPAGDLYIGTEGTGLNYLNRRTGRFEHFKVGTSSIAGNNVKELVLDNGELWIGTWQAGLDRYDTLTKTFTNYRHDPLDPQSLAHNNTYGLHREGNLLWVITYGRGLDIMDVSSETFKHFPFNPRDSNSLSSNLARTILKERDNVFWIGTNEGLNRVTTDDSGYPVSFRSFFTYEKIFSTHLAKDGTIWFGTSNSGLFHFDPKDYSFTAYTKADGLSGNTVFGILSTEKGDVWVSTENGLSVFNVASGSFTNFDHSNGLSNVEYNFHAYYKAQNGHFLFGGLNGFTSFNPADIKLKDNAPPLVISQLLHNGELVKVGDETGLLDQDINEVDHLVLDYGETNFTLQFSALDFLSSETNRYAYLLEGLDRQWQYLTGKGEVSYTIQREGDYHLLLKTASRDGRWSDEVRNIRITVLPPPYRSWWAYLLYAALFIAAVGIVTYIVRVRHQIHYQEFARQQQEELTESRLRFFTNITHEFRTPLTLILGPLEQLLNSGEHGAVLDRQLNLIKRNTDRLLNLVNQTLTFRRLVTDHEPVSAGPINAVSFVQSVCSSFEEMARIRGISLELQLREPKLMVWIDEDKIEKVLFNLLSNAFKFTPDGGTIRVTLQRSGDRAQFIVEDSGPGVEPTFREDIFKRFYEKSSGQASAIKSSGIGLSISREMVKLHGGNLTLMDGLVQPDISRLGGAVFVVDLPLGNHHFKTSELLQATIGERKPAIDQASVKPTYAPVPQEKLLPEQTQSDELSRLLIVDDNQEMLDFLQSILKGKYQLMTALNGGDGLRAARKFAPDLIISDVMMPVMDGIAFCQAVKTDLEISHIPVILLTAQTAENYLIEGLRTGADDYLTKPFNPMELSLRIRNILITRRQSRQRFVTTLALEPKEITVTDTDEEFLRSAMKVVEEEMSNPDFKVEEFASALAVSRTLLFSKVKALTGLTPNNFVKSLRMKRAAYLLDSSRMNVSEVAYKVGFRNPKYFRQCFKAQFSEVPSKYRKMGQER